jgi:hypothetical protein
MELPTTMSAPRAHLSERQRRIRARRGVAFSAGLLGFVGLAVVLVGLGAGCIFEQGSYDGGGRRTGTPTSDDTSTAGDSGSDTGTP